MTVNDCNKSLSTIFTGKFPILKYLHVPINCMLNDTMLMLIKALGAEMPMLEMLDLSYVLLKDG